MEPLDNRTKRLLDVVALLIVFSAVFVFFLPVLLRFAWHYLLCAWCLVGCVFCLIRGNRKAATAAVVLNTLIAAAGFVMVYDTMFKPSGETLTGYVTHYGIYSLPIFLFPAVGLLLMSRVSEKKDNTLRGKRHGKP